MRFLVLIPAVLAAVWLVSAIFNPFGPDAIGVYQLRETGRDHMDSRDLPDWIGTKISYYRVRDTGVVARVGASVQRYKDCDIFDADHWECRYSDGSGKFGMRNGDFWRYPEWSDFRQVSRFGYVVNNCKWWFYEGVFEGTLGCYLAAFES